MRDNKYLDRSKPDFLVHVPGNMDRNLVAIEVKSIKSDFRGRGFKNDLVKLTQFVKSAQYGNAIHLVYGNSREYSLDILNEARDLEGNNSKNIDLNKIQFWLHEKPGFPVKHINSFKER